MKPSCCVWLLLCTAVPATLLQLGACAGPAYYAQAIAGHVKLMRSRVPVADVLADPAADAQLKERLRQSEQILKFARERLELDSGGNYSQVAFTGQQAVTWNVVAAPEFSLEPRRWCFPVTGCVPYRGYFKQQSADTFARRLQDRSYDVMISPAIAYSTLGWFEDPLVDTMFQYSEEQLAGIMFHELAHEKLYVKNDTEFSEAFASFVEETGVRLWLASIEDEARLKDQERRKIAAIQFDSMLQSTRQQLRLVYESEQADETKRQNKSLLLDSLRRQYEDKVSKDWNGVSYFAGWMSGELNNAHLALMNSYEGGNCAFAALYEQAGRDLHQFYLLSIEKAALESGQRKSWLEGACGELASAPGL